MVKWCQCHCCQTVFYLFSNFNNVVCCVCFIFADSGLWTAARKGTSLVFLHHPTPPKAWCRFMGVLMLLRRGHWLKGLLLRDLYNLEHESYITAEGVSTVDYFFLYGHKRKSRFLILIESAVNIIFSLIMWTVYFSEKCPQLIALQELVEQQLARM